LTGAATAVTIAAVRRAFSIVILLAACTPMAPPAAPPSTASPMPPEEPRVETASDSYRTQAGPKGVLGGKVAERLAATVAQVLRERGAEAEPDGALAATADWFLRETAVGRNRGSEECERVARHYGFAGNILTAVTAPLEGEKSDLWRQSLSEVPVNIPITRYGVRASPAGVGAVVFGTVEASFSPIPRRVRPGQTVRVTGEVGKRFERATVYLTGVDGKVQEHRMPSRRVDVVLKFPARGVYQAEVMGDGPTGPVVVVNLPIYVGVSEPELGHAPAPAVGRTTEDGEARMLVLLNAARAKAGQRALAPDAELRAIALGHSEDMARAHFVGHVSPTTGGPEDRIKKAGVWVTGGGENISRASNAEAAHQDLMNSPGHRANMLSPMFTHVGIAIVPDGEQILATLVFGRRPDPSITSWTARQAIDAIAALRKSRGLEAVPVDSGLRAAAEAGVKVYGRGGAKAAFTEANAALQREVDRTGMNRATTCVRLFELGQPEQLPELPVVLEPKLRRMGLAITTHTQGKVTMLVLLMLTEGVKCQ
jgi:uncharacterized protein YkwD